MGAGLFFSAQRRKKRLRFPLRPSGKEREDAASRSAAGGQNMGAAAAKDSR